LCCRFIGVEGAEAASAPGSCELPGRAVIPLAARPKLIGDVEEGAEEGGTIIVDEFDEARLLDEAAEFDEMACARPSILHPVPCISAGASGIEAVLEHGQAAQLSEGNAEVTEQRRRL
jgi:hypothetical protein